MKSIWDAANPQLRDLAVYQPGKPIEETARELGADAGKIIKLASNENPLGPSPKALAAMRSALPQAHLYPDGGGYYLREALAAKLGVNRDQIILGSGSNEVIEFLGHAFLNRGDDVITSEHAFIAYKLVAAVFGAHTIEIPSPDLHHHLGALLEAITPRTRLIFIANPNNPTGTLIPQKEIDSFMERVPENVVVVFDEAYFEYLDQPPGGRSAHLFQNSGSGQSANRLWDRAVRAHPGSAKNTSAFQCEWHRPGRGARKSG
jgi:histidinol-phosphate aminotransferase